MKEQIVKIHQFVFKVKHFPESKDVISADFGIRNGRLEELSEEDMNEAYMYQKQILEGKWDWLIEKERTIKLPVCDIEVDVFDVEYDGSVKYGGGSVRSNLHIGCGYCGDENCDWDCDEAYRDIDPDEKHANRMFNAACNAIESMIMAHAIAGVNIESNAYLEGLEASYNAISNYY